MESDGAFAKNSSFFKGQTAASRFISATALLFARKVGLEMEVWLPQGQIAQSLSLWVCGSTCYGGS